MYPEAVERIKAVDQRFHDPGDLVLQNSILVFCQRRAREVGHRWKPSSPIENEMFVSDSRGAHISKERAPHTLDRKHAQLSIRKTIVELVGD
jgi:hypothetical protein